MQPEEPESRRSSEPERADTPAQEETASTAIEESSESQAPVKRPYPASMGLIGLILLVYGLSTYPAFNGPSKEAMILGAFYPPAVAAGEYWRFLTATLLHADLNHLLNNVFGILIFGQILEPFVGPGRMVILFVLSGFLGLLFSYFLLPESVTIGASAIDYGLIGAYFGIVLILRYRTDRAVFQQELRSTLIFVLLFTSWNTLQLERVNLWAHIGGLIGGLLFAFWLLGSRPSKGEKTVPPAE